MEESRDQLRRAALSQRQSLAQAECLSWSRSIQVAAIALPQYHSARSVALYSSVQNEVGTQLLLENALTSGKKVFLPKLSQPDRGGFVRFHARAELIVGRFGILEPTGTDALTAADCEGLMVFVPGVLFDRQGNRLGRGGGWYDRTLSGLSNRGVFVGLAFDVQLVDRLPAESWDRRVHYIVTEKSVIDCGAKPL